MARHRVLAYAPAALQVSDPPAGGSI